MIVNNYRLNDYEAISIRRNEVKKKAGKEHFRHNIPRNLAHTHLNALCRLEKAEKDARNTRPFSIEMIEEIVKKDGVYEIDGLPSLNIPKEVECGTYPVYRIGSLFEVCLKPNSFKKGGNLIEYDSLSFTYTNPNKKNDQGEFTRYSLAPPARLLPAFRAAMEYLLKIQDEPPQCLLNGIVPSN